MKNKYKVAIDKLSYKILIEISSLPPNKKCQIDCKIDLTPSRIRYKPFFVTK